MRWEILARSSKPRVYWVESSAAQLSEDVLAMEASGRVAARVLRGRKATTKRAFLDEAAAALQFPLYFGGNWDAFDDCLTDLSWLRAEAVVVVIADAGHLLQDASARDVDALIEVLREALRAVNDEGRAVGPKSLHLVLHTAPEDRDLFQRRWGDTDLNAVELP